MNDNYDRCRALYREARAYEGSSGADRRAVFTAIAATVATGVPAAAAATSAASVVGSGIYGLGKGAAAAGTHGTLQVLLGGKLLGGVLLGTVLGTALSTTVFVGIPAMHARGATASSSPAISAAALQSPTLRQASEVAETQPAPADVAPPKETPKPVLPVESRLHPRSATLNQLAVVTSSESRVPGEDRLLQETMALARVQNALSRKDPNLAWTLLQEQDRQFPSGQLGEERAAAKVMALCATGRAIEAATARANFATSYPNSPLTARVNQGCDHQ